MAKIEMDISEYEAMKENKKLLENSLEKERGLQEQIKKLTDEKTKALEDAKMKVVKISKSEVTEHLFRKKEDGVVHPDIESVLILKQCNKVVVENTGSLNNIDQLIHEIKIENV